MKYEDFVRLNYLPDGDLICEYYLETKENFKKAAGAVAAESSIGTWDPNLTTMKPGIEKLAAKVFEIKGNKIKIAYSLELFEIDNVSQIFSSVAGNVFGMSIIENLRLLDIEIPEEMLKSYKGPKFGISGVRSFLKIKDRPLVGTIVKPKLGLTPKEQSDVAYKTWIGGVDLVKDDENLTSMSFNRFEERVTRVLELKDRAEEETGEKKGYMPNITAPYKEMEKRANIVTDLGGKYIMIDILTSGWSSLQEISKNTKLAIHGHRAMHGAFTRNSKHGIRMIVIAKFARLMGVDQLHTGGVVGKMEGEKDEIIKINSALKSGIMKKTFPVASGGLYPGCVEKLIKIIGKDTVIQAGGGIHAHPMGSEKGAMAMRQAVEGVMEGYSLKEYAKEHEELKTAIDRWGVAE
jgi:ribulose-bisphosphate carboxylase large chain